MTVLAFDTETRGLDWWDPTQRAFLVSWATDAAPAGAHAPIGQGNPPAWDDFCAAFDAVDTVVCHNLPFDVHHLREATGIDLLASGKQLVDTAILAQIALPERRFMKAVEGDTGHAGAGYKLKTLATTFVDSAAAEGEDAIIAAAKKHGIKLKATGGFYETWLAEPELMEHYAREDARITLALYYALLEKLTPSTRRIWDLEVACGPIIMAAEARGVRVDRPKVAPLRAEYQSDADHARSHLDAALGEDWHENNEALAEALVAAGVPLTEMTDSGYPATNKWALERHAEEHPIIRTLFDYRTASKFISTYVDKLDRDIVHTSFGQIGTWTGRMSARSPNMQNVPVRAGKAIRELYIPREGYCFVGIDYEQIELRLLCYYLNDPEIQARVENDDFFAWVAARVNGGDPADYAKGTAGEGQRTICKNATYAVVYGAGGLKVGQMLGWPVDGYYAAGDWVVQRGYKQVGDPRCLRAEALIKQLKSIFTGYAELAGPRGRIPRKVQQVGSVNTILGRRQWLGYDGGWKGLSGVVQGGAADLFKLGLVAAAAAVEPLGAVPLLFIHDEILFESPIAAAEDVLAAASAAMTACYDLKPALAVDGHIAYDNWGGCK